MSQEPLITQIVAETEVEPAIYDVQVVRADGSKTTVRMNVFDLNALKERLGLPIEN